MTPREKMEMERLRSALIRRLAAANRSERDTLAQQIEHIASELRDYDRLRTIVFDKREFQVPRGRA